jgi:hypothetical protein
MISKEEYQKTLVRMWDSVRDNCKGKTDCDGVSCCECPLYRGNVCGTNARYNVYDLISMVEKWGEEHPIKTNGSEFLNKFPNSKVYGYKPLGGAGTSVVIVLDDSKSENDDNNRIEVPAEWWEKEVE